MVELEGEGYFKVTPDSKRPFIVKSGDITTEVLGTEFNVRTYVSNDSHVTLLKGSVKVKNVSSSSEVVIRPGEDAHLQGDGTFACEKSTRTITIYGRKGISILIMKPWSRSCVN
mgnify:CR=1 FL=1